MKKLFLVAALFAVSGALFAEYHDTYSKYGPDLANKALYKPHNTSLNQPVKLALNQSAKPAVVNNSTRTIAQIITTNPNFSTLLTALKAAGLVDTLNGGTEFTIFAPSNQAFAKIDKAQLDALLQDKEQLRSILLYHVIPGIFTAKDVSQLRAAQTVDGDDLKFAVYDNGLKVNGANVTRSDIPATNGVIHVLDTVLIPVG